MLESNAQTFALFSGRRPPRLWRAGAPASTDPAPYIALAAAIAWIPLVVLGFLQGVAIGPTARESVLADPAVYARFLIALPLLLYAPSRIDPMLHAILRNFLDAGLIDEASRTSFARATDAAQKARDSRVADIICLMLAYSSLVIILLVYRDVLAREIGSTWHFSGEHQRRTLAGWWYLAVSQPLYFFVLIGFVDVALQLAVGTWLFDVPLRGNLLVLVVGTLLYLMTTLGVGLLVSTVSTTQQQSFLGGFLFLLPAILLSGVMTPIRSMPGWLQAVTYLNPVRYYVEVMRTTLLKGAGFGDLWPQLAALLVLGGALLAAATLRFQKRLG